MRRVNLLPGTEVVVHWVDAEATSGQHSTVAEALEAYKPARRRTIGYFLGYAKRDGEIVLGVATDDDRTEDRPEAFGAPFYCPVCLVRKVEVLGAPPKRRK